VFTLGSVWFHRSLTNEGGNVIVSWPTFSPSILLSTTDTVITDNFDISLISPWLWRNTKLTVCLCDCLFGTHLPRNCCTDLYEILQRDESLSVIVRLAFWWRSLQESHGSTRGAEIVPCGRYCVNVELTKFVCYAADRRERGNNRWFSPSVRLSVRPSRT